MSNATNARQFTKNDWAYFAGAEPFPDSEPRIAFAGRVALVFDRQGVCLVATTEDGDALDELVIEIPDTRTARMWADAACGD